MSLYRRDDSGVWWMSLVVSNRRKRISTGTKNRKKAELIHAKVLGDIQSGKWFEQQRTLTFEELAGKYLEKYRKQRDETSMKHLKPFFGPMKLNEITPETVEDYVIKRARSAKAPKPATVYQEFSLARRIFNVARKRWKAVSHNPFADIEFSELMEIRNQRQVWLTPEDEAKLLAHATPEYLKDVIVFALHSGCRRGEILSLTWKDNVDLKRRIITVQASKNGNRKAIPMSDTLYGLMLKLSRVVHISGKVFPLEATTLKDAFERAVIKAKLDGFRFHDLRHTFATRLVQSGVDLYRVKELLGHKSIKTTERYAHHYPESLRSAVKLLDDVTFGHVLVTVEGEQGVKAVANSAQSLVKSRGFTAGSV